MSQIIDGKPCRLYRKLTENICRAVMLSGEDELVYMYANVILRLPSLGEELCLFCKELVQPTYN